VFMVCEFLCVRVRFACVFDVTIFGVSVCGCVWCVCDVVCVVLSLFCVYIYMCVFLMCVCV